MNVEQLAQYTKIQTYSLDQPNAAFTFSQRLASDNNWTADYTHRVIEEYKRFTFLAVVAGHPVTPSDQVDQAWHLHLTYSQSYWQDFCPNVLQKSLHHNPTQGGTQEKQKFDQWYAKTLSSYEQVFGAKPPVDIWPAPIDRFGRDLHFVRVNTQQNWVIPKPQLPQLSVPQPVLDVASAIASLKQKLSQPAISPNLVSIPIILGLALLITGCQATADVPFNPLNFDGPTFLGFYSCLAVVVLGTSYLMRDQLLHNPEAEQKLAELSPYEVAYYAAGERRVIATAVTSLVKQGVIEADGYRTLTHTEPRKEVQHPIEQEVSEAIEEDNDIYSVTGATLATVTEIGERVSQIVPSNSNLKNFAIRCCYLSPVIALLGLGIAKINIGQARHKPVYFLTYICFCIGFFTFMTLISKTTKQRERNRNLKKLRQTCNNSSESGAPDVYLLLAFAISGRIALSGEQFGMLKNTLIPQGYTYGADGGIVGGCGGGAGCGGGGCGGCGG